MDVFRGLSADDSSCCQAVHCECIAEAAFDARAGGGFDPESYDWLNRQVAVGLVVVVSSSLLRSLKISVMRLSIRTPYLLSSAV